MSNYNESCSKLFTFLEWIVIVCLIFFSGFFMTDVWDKYTSKDTSFKPYSEPRSILPTIVICFKPYVKKTSLDKYNITQSSLFYSEFPEEIENIWDEFYQEGYYHLDKDYDLQFHWGDYNLHEGTNDIGEGKTAEVEVLHTVWTGVCSKISFQDFKQESFLSFFVNFNESLSLEDVPQVDIYLTSEDNAYGIMGYGWNMGDELEFTLHGYEQDYKLKTIMYKYLNTSTPCGETIYNQCSLKRFEEYKFNCTNPCLAVTYEKPWKLSKKAAVNKCQTLTDYSCMKWGMNSLFTEIFDNCPKLCIATGIYKYRKPKPTFL